MSNPFMDRIAGRAKGSHGRASEKRVAKSMGAKLTPASGALPGAKSDAFRGRYRIELKSTTSQKMALEAAWLEKIGKEARDQNQIPALGITFVGPDGRDRLQLNATWIAIPKWAFLELIEHQELIESK